MNKVVPDYRSVTEEVKFNNYKSGLPKEHPFREREFDGAFKENKIKYEDIEINGC